MLRNYLKIALRNLIRHKAYSFINISGLAIGITGALLILMYVGNELSYETFHKNRDRIYRAAVDFGGKGNKMRLAGAMPALAPAVIDHLPEIETAVRFRRDTKAKIKFDSNTFKEQNLFFVDPAVFEIFSFTLKQGNEEFALSQPFSMVITEDLARKYFGVEDAIGKTVIYNGNYSLRVTGILKNIPPNTHLNCEIMVSYASLASMGTDVKSWNSFGQDYTYLLLKKGTDAKSLQPKLRELLRKNSSDAFANMIDFNLQALTDIHTNHDTVGDLGPKGNKIYISIFSMVALLLLLIACLNFVNLSTARSLKRLREVGMRKVLGAIRFQLIAQFLGESFLVVIFSVILALGLFELFYPALNSFLENSLVISEQNYKFLYFLIPGVAILVAILAGSYPAFFISRYRPAESLKNVLPTLKPSTLRRTLVIVQFAISIVLIIGCVVVFKQLYFMKNSDPGFERKNVLIFDLSHGEQGAWQKYSVLKKQFLQNPNVLSISGAYSVPGIQNTEKKGISKVGAPPEEITMIQSLAVDYDYVETMKLDLVQGRNFSVSFATDAKEAVVLNQAAVRQLQLNQPIGEELMLPVKDGMTKVRVIGVIRDFHLYSFKEKIESLLLYINPDYYYLMAVKIRPENVRTTLTALEEIWKQVLWDMPFHYTYLEDTYNSLYLAEEKISRLLAIFAGLAVFVACLGLFGLVSFMTERRSKEVGIRKVLGATVKRVIMLLLSDFTKWILLANFLAWPVGYFIMRRWLQNFAYHIEISWWVFVLAGGLALGIALLTVSTQAVRAALANPVEALRYE